MKTLPQTLLVFFICLQACFFSGCNLVEEPASHIAPQFSGETCSDFGADDLDLSGGFPGTIHKNPRSAAYDFTVTGFDAHFPLPPAMEAGDCHGFCGFRITFEPFQNPTLDVNSLEVADISMTYDDGTSVVSAAAAFTWNYPTLDINDVVTGTIVDYDILFADSQGDNLQVVSQEVLSGLCVIENVDLIKPPTIINL